MYVKFSYANEFDFELPSKLPLFKRLYKFCSVFFWALRFHGIRHVSDQNHFLSLSIIQQFYVFETSNEGCTMLENFRFLEILCALCSTLWPRSQPGLNIKNARIRLSCSPWIPTRLSSPNMYVNEDITIRYMGNTDEN